MRICTKYVLLPALQRTRPQFNGWVLIAMQLVVSNACHHRKVIMLLEHAYRPIGIDRHYFLDLIGRGKLSPLSLIELMP